MNENLPIADAPNLGPASTRMLDRAGITTFSELRRIGSVAACELAGWKFNLDPGAALR